MKLFIGLSLMFVHVWASGRPLMDGASFEKNDSPCPVDYFITDHEITINGGTKTDYKLISVLCAKAIQDVDILEEPHLEFRLYKKGVLVTKFSKKVPLHEQEIDSGEHLGRSDEYRRDDTEGRGTGVRHRRRSAQTASQARTKWKIRTLLKRFKEAVNENDVKNYIVVEPQGDSESEQFVIYFKKQWFRPVILERNVVDNTNCFRLPIFMLNKEPLEASGSVSGSIVAVMAGAASVMGNVKDVSGDKGGSDPSKPATTYIEGVPWSAADDKCPSGGGSTAAAAGGSTEASGSGSAGSEVPKPAAKE